MSDLRPGETSPDGQWVWDGQQWLPSTPEPQPSTQHVSNPYRISTDGSMVFDGWRWWPVAQVPAGTVCDDGRWLWTGTEWQPNHTQAPLVAEVGPESDPAKTPAAEGSPSRTPDRRLLVGGAAGVVAILLVLGIAWAVSSGGSSTPSTLAASPAASDSSLATEPETAEPTQKKATPTPTLTTSTPTPQTTRSPVTRPPAAPPTYQSDAPRPGNPTNVDPSFSTCKEANANGYGNYKRGQPEYNWYRDRDNDGIVCER